MIWDALSEDHGLTWKEIADRTKGIGSEALAKYLNLFVSLDAVLHEGKLYRKNPTFALPYDKYRKITPTSPMKYVDYSDIKTTEDLFLRIELVFERAYVQYIMLLQRIVKESKRTTARELFELVFAVEIEPYLVSLSRFVWDNRDAIKIANVEPFAALYRFRSVPLCYDMTEFAQARFKAAPGYTIEEFSATYRKIGKEDKARVQK